MFVDHPEVPMDNNVGERALRGPAIGRKLSFGSDSEAGARMSAVMYSVLGTVATSCAGSGRGLKPARRTADARPPTCRPGCRGR